MPLFFQRLFLGACLLLAATTAQAQTVNVDAVTRYWEITDGLRQNKPLTDQVWHDFLEIPGNKVYVRGIFTPEMLARYRQAIEGVYMPRYDSLRRAKLAANVWYYVLVNDYKQREPEYRDFVAKVTKEAVSLDQMYQCAYEYLPARAHTKVANLNIYYGALGNDATSQAEGLFYSLRSMREANEVRPGILQGHEVHHQLRPRKNFGTIAAADEGLMGIIGSIQNEGLADLIDKAPELAAPGDPKGIREWILDPAPAFIHKMDSAIQSQARGGAPAPGRYYRQLSNGSNGHLPGFFMALAIQRNGYTRQLIKAADDPFAFFYLYQKAASKDKTPLPRFSDESLRFLKALERKYAKPQPGAATAKS